jgi:pyrimidine-nucleoside phosphorylase
MESFTCAILEGKVLDAQIAAWTMAVYFQGLSSEALFALTQAMVKSGQILDLAPIEGTVVDKHSTGGVGDKTTLVVAPLVASFGVPVIKLSGRALGHSGGTVDKLESIPGFQSQLTGEEIIAQGKDLGLVLAGHSSNLAPLDAKIYQLRDSCATVESIPLIASSIISKKLAGGADGFVFDVKVGRGAFMKTMDDARRLAGSLLELARFAGRGAQVLFSSMEEPLGLTVGNALEVREALETLEGKGPSDLVELSVALASSMLDLAGIKAERQEILEKLASGKAREKFAQMVEAQGGKLQELPVAPCKEPLLSPRAGFVEGWDTQQLGLVARALTGSRGAAGIEIVAKRGAKVEAGEPLAFIHSECHEDFPWAREALARCTKVGSSKPCEIPLLIEERSQS